MAHEEQRLLIDLHLLANRVRDRRPSGDVSVRETGITRIGVNRLLEFATETEIFAVDLSELLWCWIDVLEIPLKLIFELVRADDDVQLWQGGDT